MPQRSDRLPFLEDEQEKSRKAIALMVTLLVHALGGWAIYTIKPIERVRQVILEVTMAQAEPEPEPEPEEDVQLEPEPEPEPEPERPDVVDYDQTVEDPTPDAPPESAPADKPVRLVQGLSASSFAQGGTGFSVRAGTTLRTKATDDTMDLDEAANSVAFSAVTRQPRVRSWPRVVVPDSVKALGLEGVVKLRLDIDDEGRVLDVRVEQGLHPDADRACIDAWRKARIAPARQGDRTVTVLNVPYRCRIEILQ